MVGFAISLFYILLLSISEHTSFLTAYLISSAATVILVSAYTKSMLKSLPVAAIVAAFLAFLYGFLYIILQLEDYALLMGSIGLFTILSVIMFITRKIDWYNLAVGCNQGSGKENIPPATRGTPGSLTKETKGQSAPPPVIPD